MSDCFMYLVQPIAITPAKLISTTAVETTPAWVQGTAYAKDAQVSYVGKLGLPHNWLSLTAANTATPGSDATKWIDMGADNKSAMFDNYNSTQSVGTNTLQVVIKPGQVFTDLALFNLIGSSVRAEVIGANNAVIYDQTKSLTKRNTASWSEYYFKGFDGRLTQAFFTGMPFNTSASIRITVTGVGAVAVGRLVTGRRQNLGELEFGVSPYLTDYSRKQWDADFGDYEWTVRDYARGFRGNLLIENGQLNRVWSTLISVRAVPTLYVGSEDERFSETLVTLGVMQDAPASINYPMHTMLNFNVEGLT